MKKYLLKGLIISALMAILLLTFTESNITTSPKQGAHRPLNVSVIKVTPVTSTLVVTTTGITAARWPLTIKSAVSGRVLSIDDETEPGKSVSEGQLLMTISPTSYQVSIANAEAKVSKAEFELESYQHKQYVAEKVSGEKSLSAFGRFVPHIRMAKSDLSYAISELHYAREMLEETNIESPFDAIVVRKFVTPSQWVEVGQPLFELMSSKKVDVNVQLSEQEWHRLRFNIGIGSKAKVRSSSNEEWDAKVRYLSPVLDTTSRQRSITLTVDNPYISTQPILPQQFVHVVFKGESITSLVSAPSTVLTPDGRVWTLENNLLHIEKVELIEERGDLIKFKYSVEPNKPRLLVRFPLSSMLEGQIAEPQLKEDTL